MLSRIYAQQGDQEACKDAARQSLKLCRETGDRSGIALGLQSLGNAFLAEGKFGESVLHFEQSISAYQELGQHDRVAYSMAMMGLAVAATGSYPRAYEEGTRALAHAQQRSNPQELFSAYTCLAWAQIGMGDLAEAQACLDRSLAICRALGLRLELVVTLTPMGLVARGMRDGERARGCLAEAIRTYTSVRPLSPSVLGWVLAVGALLVLDQGDVPLAIEIYAAATRVPYVANSRWFEDVAGRHIAAAAASLSPDVVAAAQARGRARDPSTTVMGLLTTLAQAEQ